MDVKETIGKAATALLIGRIRKRFLFENFLNQHTIIDIIYVKSNSGLQEGQKTLNII